jgi:ATP-dependent helicase/nuclease subunit B
VSAAADGQQLLRCGERDHRCRWQQCTENAQQQECCKAPHAVSVHAGAGACLYDIKHKVQLPGSIAVAIENGFTVIASSARAARALRRSYGEAQRALGLEAWQSPDILDWDSWLNRCWQKRLRSGAENRLLLTTLQEQQIWVRLVKPSIEGRRLISVLGVAELAQQAYALLCNYRALDFLNGERLAGTDVESFRQWARAFSQTCTREEWLSRSQLPLALAEAMLNNHVEPTTRLLLTGFDRFTPSQQHLIEALEQLGHPVEIADSSTISAAELPVLVQAVHKQDEIATCALWVRHQLAAAAEGNSPRIAVVVPAVSSVRAEIERIFRRILVPRAVPIGVRDLPLPFEFSLGVPLAEVPMARAALLLLRWINRALPQDQASWLMLSGFICEHQGELLPMAAFDARLRTQSMRQPEQDLDTFLQFLNRAWQEAAPLDPLRHRLRSARRLLPTNGALNFAEWASLAERILNTVHWSGPHTQGSEDFQVQARWSQLLDAVAALAFDGRKVDYAAFLEVLEHHARQTIFAPESRDAPVQILGPFEAAGLTFDALWFLGADDASWPPVARPHPFLTRSLQRKHEMPHANSDVDWKLAQQATTRLENSATRCVFSYAAQDGESACRPSTLVNFGERQVTADHLRTLIGAEEDLAAEHDIPLVVKDEEPAAVLPWPVEKDAGGADILRNQAACPFRAFATRRLAARAIDETDWGLNYGERGSVVHAILEKLWAELKNRNSLLQARRDGRLTAVVERHVEEALARYKVDGPKQIWNHAYLDAERHRILSLIEEWLAYEESRTDFTVESREEKRTAVVGDLKLQVRVDRVDAVNGGRVIIDYKTGAVRKELWDGPRPDDPQLPIYAGYGQVEDLKGVLLGRVAEDKLEFIGRVEDGGLIIPGDTSLSNPPYSAEMLQGWQTVLLNLAQQFLNGEAQVEPKQYPDTCKFCDLPGLCRIAESERARTDDDDGESDGESA